MNLIDSSVWITFFEEGRVDLGEYLQRPGGALVPTLVIHEVYRQLLKKLDEKEALYYVAQMEEGNPVVLLDQEIALMAAEIRHRQKLGMADAVLYATTLIHEATLVTFDNDFRGLPQCVVLKSES